jgi:hypothetical protein
MPGPRQVRSGDQPQDRKAPGLGVPPLLQQRADEVIASERIAIFVLTLLMRARAGQLFGYGTSDQSSKLTRGLGTKAAAGFVIQAARVISLLGGGHRYARRQAVFFVPSLTPAA